MRIQIKQLEEDGGKVWEGSQNKGAIIWEMNNQVRNFEEAILAVEKEMTELSKHFLHDYTKHKVWSVWNKRE